MVAPDAQAQGFNRCEEVIKTTRQRHWVSDSGINPHQGAGLDQRPVCLPHINPEKESQGRVGNVWGACSRPQCSQGQ